MGFKGRREVSGRRGLTKPLWFEPPLNSFGESLSTVFAISVFKRLRRHSCSPSGRRGERDGINGQHVLWCRFGIRFILTNTCSPTSKTSTSCAFLSGSHHLQNVAEALEAYARIHVPLGETQLWNRGFHHPPGCCAMRRAAERVDPNARIWRGKGLLEKQGGRVLGIPIGHVDLRNHREALNYFRTSSKSARSAECVAVASVLRQITCATSTVCSGARRSKMEVLPVPFPPTDKTWQSSFRSGSVWVAVRHEVVSLCSLGQLDRQLEDDSSRASRSGEHNDQTAV